MLILRSKVTPQRLPKLGRAPGPDWLAIRAIARSAWLHGWLRAYLLDLANDPETARRLLNRWPTVNAATQASGVTERLRDCPHLQITTNFIAA
jgi:hypothetical protein